MNKFLSLFDSAYQCLVEALETLRRGGLVCLPTETVYGMVCAADRPDAVQMMYEAKGRPADKPFALFTNDLNGIQKAGAVVNQTAQTLADAFWPGPLTLVLSASDDCPYAHQGSVGVRSPDHEFVQTLLQRYGGLLVNSSLNKSGELPVWELSSKMPILAYMDLIVDGGRLPKQKPSTVVDCRDEWDKEGTIKILREGALSQKQIEAAINQSD